jgi:hypothetical protein
MVTAKSTSSFPSVAWLLRKPQVGTVQAAIGPDLHKIGMRRVVAAVMVDGTGDQGTLAVCGTKLVGRNRRLGEIRARLSTKNGKRRVVFGLVASKVAAASSSESEDNGKSAERNRRLMHLHDEDDLVFLSRQKVLAMLLCILTLVLAI